MRLSNTDYERIMRDYDSKQYRSNALFLEKKERLYNSIPELKTLEEELATSFAESAKQSIFLPVSDFEKLSLELSEKRAKLQEERLALMEKHGFPPDYLEDIFSCSTCKDTGYVGGLKCHCFESIARKLLKNREFLSKLPENSRFNLFREDYYQETDYYEETGKNSRENALASLEIAKEFTEHFASSSDNLLIYGNTGTGKTFLAGCIANELADEGFSVSFITAFHFYGLLEKYHFHKSDKDYFETDDSVEYILNSDLLVLDDIGTEFVNQFTLTKLYEFINERLLKAKSTIITTNFDPQTIKKNYGERILSRLAGNYNFIKLTGEDIRMLKGSKDLD